MSRDKSAAGKDRGAVPSVEATFTRARGKVETQVERSPVPRRALAPPVIERDDGAQARVLAILRRGPAAVALERLQDGDPLGLYPRVSHRLRARALLLDVDRVHGRTLVQVARLGPSIEGAPNLESWLDARIDEAVASTIRQDQQDEAANLPLDFDETRQYDFMILSFGIPPASARRSSLAFNGLADWDRQAFFALLMDGKTVQEVLDMGFRPPERLRERVLRGLKVILLTPEEIDEYEAHCEERDSLGRRKRPKRRKK